jgi:hypothetical protein
MRKQTGLADPHRGENRRVCRIWKFTTVVITGKTATHDGRVLPFSICLVVCAKFIHADFTSAARAGFENGHRDRFAHPISTTPPLRMPRADQGEVAKRLRRLLAQDDLSNFDLDQYCLLSKCIG